MGDLTFPFYLGPYKVVSTLGTGGFATVYRAVVEGGMGFTREVALKVLHGHITRSDPRVVTMLADEAMLLARMQHPNIVYVQWFGQVEHPVDGVVFAMMMEYVPGRTLREVSESARAAGETMPLSVALDVHLDMLRGLRFAHELKATDGTPLGLVHRDLKPDNVIISAEGAVKLLDFGIAKASERLVEKTETNMIRGTVHYMSPEQVRGEDLDFRSDLFSFGAMLCEALTGKRVIHGQTLIAAMHAVASFQPESTLDDVRRTLPSAAPFVARLIAPRPEDRFASTAEAVVAMQRLRDAVPTSEMSSAFLTRRVTAVGAASAGDDATEARPAPTPRASDRSPPGTEAGTPATTDATRAQTPIAGANHPQSPRGSRTGSAPTDATRAQVPVAPRRGWRSALLVGLLVVGAAGVLLGTWSLLRPDPAPTPDGDGVDGVAAVDTAVEPPAIAPGPEALPDLAAGLVVAVPPPDLPAIRERQERTAPTPARGAIPDRPASAPTPTPAVTVADPPLSAEPGVLKIGADKPFELSIATKRYKQLEAAKGISLPAGTYRVRLDCLQCEPPLNSVRELSLEVRAGAETKQVVRFADGP